MRTGRYIRFIVTMLMLLMFGVGEMWAADITVTIGDITANTGTVTSSIDQTTRVVTLTVTPASGYYIKASDIVVNPLAGSNQANAPRRVPDLANRIEGKLYIAVLNTETNQYEDKEVYTVSASQVGKYVFTVPSGYDGVYVNATFTGVSSTEIEITSSTTTVTYSETGTYTLLDDIDASVLANLYTGSQETGKEFAGTFKGVAKADGTFPVIRNLDHPLFATATGATICNIMFKDITVSGSGPVGAICGTANGTTRIYNCGILPNTAKHEANDRSTVASEDNYCGSLVGYLDGYARVINCFSYANITGGTTVAGIVGYNSTATKQGDENSFTTNVKTMVMNCMFYGEITDGTTKYPVYGGETIYNNHAIDTAPASGDCINNYNYFYEGASFDESYTTIADYNYSWPVAEKYLTRFEIYRSILNSNRRLCTWWVSGERAKCPTDANVETVSIAKWVLDLSIAPYPILKKWAKYPSVINQDPDKRIDPSTKAWVNRRNESNHWGKNMEPDTEGQILGTIIVNINGGDHHSGSASRTINITAMDTEYKDYCYGKIQLPYYNEIFGNPNGTSWSAKYGDNYTSYVVTGWEITSVSGGTAGTFDGSSPNAWESGYNFADRKCTDKDKYSVSGRVFAQGGYYYVPDGVTAITITAHWGNAVYLRNTNNRLDRVNNATNDFYIAGELKFAGTTGVLPLWPSGNTLKNTLSGAVSALKTISETPTVYDQAIVLVSNYQNNGFNGNITLKGSEYATNAKPFTIMSADFDFDNEPDFCFQGGMNAGGRINCHPIRFDFLMVPDITMAIRTNEYYWGMRIWCPQGHFEVTETSYMYTTQFEYDERSANDYKKHESPMILNGGEHMQIVSSESFGEASTDGTATSRVDATSYFLMGGNVYMKAFTPGCHGNKKIGTRHCAVNAIGGEYPEFYLSGMFRNDFYNMTDNPHCYIDGGKFGIVAGAGMESVGGKNETNGGDVTFLVNHSLIDEFYGGGINANRPVTGNINVTIDNSKVVKYCGGPKLGDMSNTKTITTNATGTTFDEFYGGGNGGTNNERRRIKDSGGPVAAPTYANRASAWGSGSGYGFNDFSPFRYDNGYETEFEFELLPDTRGNTDVNKQVIKRTYSYWATFAKTTVAPITNTITDCTFNGDFYGGGNLGAVESPTSSTNPAISSTLKGNTVVHGSAFGAGYTASATTFQVHDKSTVVYPYRDFAGFIHDGSLKHSSIQYTWIHELPTGVTASTSNPTFTYDNKYYCYTPVSLEGLGTVTGDVSLTIEGNTVVMGKVVNVTKDANGNKVITYGAQTGGVFGGGNSSGVVGNTTVIINTSGQQTTEGYDYNVYNVFGGGNKAEVQGNSIVTIKNNSDVKNNVFGAGNEANVTGSSTVNVVKE